MREGSAIGTLLVVGVVAAAAAALVSTSHDFSRERIAANERARLVTALSRVLAPQLRDRDLVTARLAIADPLLGSEEPVDVFVMSSSAGEDVAVVFAAVAPQG